MKILQLNIWQGRLIQNALKLFKKENPDIVCLQELCSTEGQTGFLDFDNLEVIQRAFGYPHVLFFPVYDFRLMDTKVKFGNTILSRFPVIKQKQIFTSGKYQSNLTFSNREGQIRNLLHAVIDNAGHRYNVLTHHGYWVHGNKVGNRETLKQMKQIGSYLDGLDGPIILTGDFNLLPNSTSLKQINQRLTNLCITHKIKTTRNQFSFKAKEVCDYIFVSDNIKLNQFKVCHEVVSDHQALVAQLK